MIKREIKIYVCINALKKDEEFIKSLQDISNIICFHPSKKRPKNEELCDIVRDYDIVICGINEKMDSQVAKCAKRLKIIASLSVGLDHIKVEQFKRVGVEIINIPHSNAISVAEHTWAMILALSKRLFESDKAVRRGQGRSGITDRPIELYGKALGIIGAGQIAYHVAKIGCSFGMRVLIWTFHPERHNEFKQFNSYFASNLEELINLCDVLTIHIPFTKETYKLINKDLIAKEKRNNPLMLINTSREDIIERNTILYGMNKGVIERCALDVFYEDEVIKLPKDRIILTPHIAGLTKEALKKMRMDLVENIKKKIM